ncbi:MULTISPECIES: alpha/beta fold hydrolase [Streptomyces]|uniref:Alpha/beta hydrolase n=1 Tax=Streptomyces tsukubensis (strain DSM 42081 / NBRC 108919 / NRRL 18488 / 9993) TaxID=1114943 RepID=I2MX22_STRT9|nr:MULTISPECIES: alpha/beta hydrolase [Streptomyces]AZK93725.1 alpha/beta hydrolase [Streptomyces tsukubensis]EIF89319.1 alpha/beta fold family hydrolase protein [Streptomyces tsukubensis NRRL18488]MYS63637.1 alpha/beta fold hydrolase [Streptomyces sp. SID5473]QKM70135.1 alpha/beta hydrolase [Streptomyces tsukubensis NRRL18488]TAI45887.1 alpha/beta hydrolase [Streptomyces tsukubensis]
MTEYVLIPGADGRAWYWHRVVPELRARGHEAVAVDLPEDNTAGLADYTDAVIEQLDAASGRLVVVAQSLAGFVAPLLCGRIPVEKLILVNAMVPAPGESAGEWWAGTGHPEARRIAALRDGRDPEAPFDPLVDFFHDVPPEIADEALAIGPPGGPSEALFADPWPLDAWPDVPTRFLQGRDDRFFPLEFQRKVVAERLGVPVEPLPGGHLIALARPEQLTDWICG